uniref:SH3 domain-containing protein n=1 Tax=Rhabditophanes sp. KR3021 TaxID=114890 RepID=A0AC35U3K1_9BILA
MDKAQNVDKNNLLLEDFTKSEWIKNCGRNRIKIIVKVYIVGESYLEFETLVVSVQKRADHTGWFKGSSVKKLKTYKKQKVGVVSYDSKEMFGPYFLHAPKKAKNSDEAIDIARIPPTETSFKLVEYHGNPMQENI